METTTSTCEGNRRDIRWSNGANAKHKDSYPTNRETILFTHIHKFRTQLTYIDKYSAWWIDSLCKNLPYCKTYYPQQQSPSPMRGFESGDNNQHYFVCPQWYHLAGRIRLKKTIVSEVNKNLYNTTVRILHRIEHRVKTALPLMTYPSPTVPNVD